MTDSLCLHDDSLWCHTTRPEDRDLIVVDRDSIAVIWQMNILDPNLRLVGPMRRRHEDLISPDHQYG
jgi:hypothetical protein